MGRLLHLLLVEGRRAGPAEHSQALCLVRFCNDGPALPPFALKHRPESTGFYFSGNLSPHQELNLDLDVRSVLFYPLNYGEKLLMRPDYL